MKIDQLKNLLQQYGIKPSKGKGQNFLINNGILQKIIKAADLSFDDYVLEIGPGFGVLTEALLKDSKKVLSVELDKSLFFFLKKKFKQAKNFELLEADILKIRNEEIVKLLKCGKVGYKLIANLPYAISKPVLQKFLVYDPKPKEIVVLLQKEVAQKIIARPGQMSILSLSVQFYGRPQIIDSVAKQNFYPEPKVESAILKIKVNNDLLPREIKKILEGVDFEIKKFWQLVKIGFSSPRKQLQNNLSAGFKISKIDTKNKLKLANLNDNVRPQDLSLADWARLYLQFMV